MVGTFARGQSPAHEGSWQGGQATARPHDDEPEDHDFMKTLTMRGAAGASWLLAVTLTGCAAQTDSPKATTSSSGPSASAPPSVPAEAEPLLAEYGLEGMGTVEIIDHLDRLGGAERPQDLMASVRPDELVVAAGSDEFGLEIPDDRFYLSVAPYVDQTHECFNHSLTTCTGELASTDVHVQIVDETNDKVLVDETRTTFDNGFTGFWLPRNIEGTLRVTYDGRTAETDFTTDQDAPTCLTTVQLV